MHVFLPAAKDYYNASNVSHTKSMLRIWAKQNIDCMQLLQKFQQFTAFSARIVG